MGTINFCLRIVLFCSVNVCSISAETAPNRSSSPYPTSALEQSSFFVSQTPSQPSAVPSASSKRDQQLQSVSSPTPTSSASLSPKDFPLLPAPITMPDNISAPLWWNPPDDQSTANNSPPAPSAPTADTHSVPHEPLEVSPTPSLNKELPHIIMKDGKDFRGLGGGAKTGISFAVIIVVILAVIAVYVHLSRKQNMKRMNTVNGYL